MSAPAAVLRVTTRLVVVDVVAADKRGQAVADLKAEDFTLLEDGKPQQIRVFSFEHPPLPGASFVPKALNLPPHVFTNIPTYNASNTLNIILLDGLNTTLPNQAYARQQMINYLDKIPAGQPIAVYLLGRKLRLVLDFTADPSVLKTAIKSMKSQASPFMDHPLGGTQEPDLVGRDMPLQMQQVLKAFAEEQLSFQTDLRVEYTIDALNALARALSGYQGRKNLIWISEAFPINIAPDMSLGINASNRVRQYEEKITETAEALVDAQIAIYPIDARGVASAPLFDAKSTRINPAAALGQTDPVQQQMDDQTSNILASHDTMKELAQRTGGRAYYNRNDLDDAIRNSMEDGSTYYTLAYYPATKDWNGKFRKVEVKVNRPGITLRHRPGYYAFDPTAARDPKLRFAAFGQALSLDTPIATGLRFEAGIVPPSAKAGKVIVNFALDPRGISFEKQDDDLQHAKVDCAVRAFTPKGQLVKTEASTVTPAYKPDAFTQVMQSLFYCHQSIELPAGDYLLRLGVLDQHTGLIGTTNAKITVSSTVAHDDKRD
ncbi:MAG TPA: VWA domain-containing protein [Candidatus Angelobacter sp.]